MSAKMWSNRISSWLVWMQTSTVTLEDRLAISYKANQSYHTVQLLSSLVLTPRCGKHVYAKPWRWMLIVTWFILAKPWKQSICPLMGDWINKLWYTHALEYYSSIRGNMLYSHRRTQRDLKWILLRERSLCEKNLHTVWFQLHEILESPSNSNSGKISGYQEFKEKNTGKYKWGPEDF